MESVLKSAARKFVQSEHIKNLLALDQWLPLYDEQGHLLPGIQGKIGAVGSSADGVEIGVDMVEMQPGSAFPLHVHPGDHVLYVMDGAAGLVHIAGEDRHVVPGDSIFIAADSPHGVKTYPSADKPLRFLAFGVPHKHVSSTERMRYVDEGGNFIHTSGHSHGAGHHHH